MTNQTPESVIAEVIEHHADTIGSHYEGCYKNHAGCLAVRLRDMLREPGEAAARCSGCDRPAALCAHCAAEAPEIDLTALIRETKVEAFEEAATAVAEQGAGYANTASRMHDDGEWADSSRYSNYAAGLAMALASMRSRAAEYRKGARE